MGGGELRVGRGIEQGGPGRVCWVCQVTLSAEKNQHTKISHSPDIITATVIEHFIHVLTCARDDVKQSVQDQNVEDERGPAL